MDDLEIFNKAMAAMQNGSITSWNDSELEAARETTYGQNHGLTPLPVILATRNRIENLLSERKTRSQHTELRMDNAKIILLTRIILILTVISIIVALAAWIFPIQVKTAQKDDFPQQSVST